MKHTYRVRVQPHHYSPQPLTKETLLRTLGEVAIRELAAGGRGDTIVDVQLQRPTHEQALNEILVALQNLGYSWVEATVTEWTDNALGGLLFGGGAGGSAGFASGDAGLGVLLTLLGGLVGTVIGSFIESKKVVYQVQWTGRGYEVVQVDPAPVPAPGVQPRLA